MNSVYEKCPTYETEHFKIRNVQVTDAEDLLCCYSDLEAAELFNSDNCTNNFFYTTLDEMKQCIEFWLEEYRKQYYIRFSIVEKGTEKVIGTIEIFNKETFGKLKNVGILRLDLCSEYETEHFLGELIKMSNQHFYEAFGLENIMTKAISKAANRIKVLANNCYIPVIGHSVMPFDNYYIRNCITSSDTSEHIRQLF
jgi:[ribosomal protein S5]-alanine N-acetyltransferase